MTRKETMLHILELGLKEDGTFFTNEEKVDLLEMYFNDDFYYNKGWNDGYQECQKLLLVERKYTEEDMRKVWNLAIENQALIKNNLLINQTYEELIESLNN